MPGDKNHLAERLAEILALDNKALPGPWSSKVLRDYRISPHDNDTPYVYGPNDVKAMMGLWPIHGPRPEDTADAERQTFATIELVVALRNLIAAHGAELLALARHAASAVEDGEKTSYRIGYVDGATNCPPQVTLTKPERETVMLARQTYLTTHQESATEDGS